MIDQADKLLWSYLIKKGGIVENESYYGMTIDIVGTQQLRESVEKNPDSINWNKTKPVEQDTDYKFVGTFADDERVEYLKGVLVTKQNEYKFYLELGDMKIKDVISDVLSTGDYKQ